MATTYGSLSGGFGTVPTVRKPKPQPAQIDTNGRQVGASFTPSAPKGGGGGVSSTGAPGLGHTITGTIGTNPGQSGAGKSSTTPLGTTPAAKGSNPGGAASGIAPPPPPAGAPDPGTPNTGAIPPIQSDEDLITDANTDYGTTYGGLYQGIQSAASTYGDPTIMGQYGVGAVNPNSALALAAVKALQANQANDATQTNNGTFFSSINQTARGNIGEQQSRDDLAAQQAWQDALGKFNTAVSTAASTRDRIIRNAREDEGNQAIKNLPTTAAPVPKPPLPGGGGQQAAPPTAGSGFSGLRAATPPKGFSGYGASPPRPLINVPKVKSGFGYRGGF